tara:strand:- start:1145 stop:2095 length:951 start_codon:yes stop_codon:yes gene_type:complete
MVECKVCKEKFKDDPSLHRHLRAHKVLVVDYYHAYFPRKDFLTGDLIKFKNKDQYFTDDFNSRPNMKKWLDTISEEEAKNYCHTYIQKRIRKKGMTYALCEVEARSLMCPPIPYFQKVFEDYYHYVGTNFKLKHKYTKWPDDKSLKIKNVKSGFLKNMYSICIDTREQKPLKFNLPVEVKTLSFGDYCSNQADKDKVYIERKSITDFIGTMSGGYERFTKEVERAKADGSDLIVVVEESLTSCLSFNFLPYVSKKIKATPEYIFHNVRQLIQEYDNLHFLFVKGRPESSRVIEKILLYSSRFKGVDLQLAYDLKLL